MSSHETKFTKGEEAIKARTVRVGKSECRVETLHEWLKSRMESLQEAQARYQDSSFPHGDISAQGRINRLSELGIILDKITDGRIQEIGFPAKKEPPTQKELIDILKNITDKIDKHFYSLPEDNENEGKEWKRLYEMSCELIQRAEEN